MFMPTSTPAKDYVVVSARDLDELEQRVREYLSCGWTPLGGMQVGTAPTRLPSVLYHQTMVLYKARTDSPKSGEQSQQLTSDEINELLFGDGDGSNGLSR